MYDIAKELFGTEDYQSALEELAPSDFLVREFYKRVSQLEVKHGN